MTDSEILINVPGVDWVTVTTYEAKVWRAAVKDCLGDVSVSPRAQNRQGYKGFVNGSFWYGQGTQEGREHFAATVSGKDAHPLHRVLLESMTCTRIDLQVTIELPTWYDNRELTRTLREGVWPGRRRTIPLREDGKGGSTVYIGSPASDKLIRVYVKGKHYLRYEIQYRRSYAEDAAKQVMLGGNLAIGAILGAELAKLPTHPVFDVYRPFCKGNAGVQGYKANPDMVSRLRWLSGLLDTFQTMANDHDYGHTVRGWFQDILDNARMLE